MTTITEARPADFVEGFPYDPNDAAWGNPLWPAWLKGFRSHQVTAILEALDHFNNGVDVVMMSAPTGAGKTVIAEAVRRLLCVSQTMYVANTKGLQDQFIADFGGYAKCLKGRSNYPTLDQPHLFSDRFQSLSAGDCVKSKEEMPACGSCTSSSDIPVMHCQYCHPWVSCPYEVAKRDALAAPLTVTNTSYFIAETNGPARFSGFPMVIVDECDTLESILMGNIEVNISERRRKQYGIGKPKLKTVEDSWMEWLIDDARPKLVHARKVIGRPTTIKANKEARYIDRMLGKLEVLEGELLVGNALYDEYSRSEAVVFKPVRVDNRAPEMLWRHANKWLMMSATIIDPGGYAESLGIDAAGKRWEIVNVPSTFPPENRPIHIKPIVEMTFKTKAEAWPAMVEGIKSVLKKHPTDRTLIHTVSYSFAQYVFDKLRTSGRQLFIYSDAKEREEVLENFRVSNGGVLLAPSMERGVDLPGDDCRVIIVPKMPYLSTQDKVVARRMHQAGGRSWYRVQTIRSLVQMTGRGVRSETDQCHCVAPGTLVLTGDLRWVPVEDLQVGSSLYAFDESTSRIDPRRWRHGEVVATGVQTTRRFRVHLADGRSLVATGDHRWISKWGQAKDDKWVCTERLRPGHHLNLYVTPWDVPTDFDTGWLSGLFDGEGCLTLRAGKRNPSVSNLMISQKIGPVLDRAESILTKRGFTTRRSMNSSGNDVCNLVVQGGLAEQLRCLGQVRPMRLLKKFENANPRFESREYVEVVWVEPIADGPVVTLQSSTGTYVAEGFAAHNTYILDKQFLSNVYKEGRQLLPDWWQEAIDWTGGGI